MPANTAFVAILSFWLRFDCFTFYCKATFWILLCHNRILLIAASEALRADFGDILSTVLLQLPRLMIYPFLKTKVKSRQPQTNLQTQRLYALSNATNFWFIQTCKHWDGSRKPCKVLGSQVLLMKGHPAWHLIPRPALRAVAGKIGVAQHESN